MNISNKSMALLLVAAVIISLGGTIISLNKLNEVVLIAPARVTGMVTNGTGQINLSIETNASCTVDSNVLFGSGDLGGADISLSSDVANTGNFTDCSAVTSACGGIIVNNTGNVLLNVSFNASSAGAAFLGAPNADSDFRYYINETQADTTDGCGLNGTPVWTQVPTTSTENNVCGDLNFSDARDTVIIEINVSLDANTEPGTKTTEIYVGCTTA